MSALTIVFPWDNDSEHVVSADVMALIDKFTKGRADYFSREIAIKVNKQLVKRAKMPEEGQTPLIKAQAELYIYALFVGDRRPSEMTWLSQIIGGNAVQSLCGARRTMREKGQHPILRTAA